MLNLCLEIDLSELQKKLDSQGLELVENQKESVVGRKGLADKTKGRVGFCLTHLKLIRLANRLQKAPRG